MTTHERPFGRFLEDFVVGDVYRHRPGKTITEYDDHLFCMITMNHHPLHTNAW
ncbi:MAG: putative hydratase, partial [Actinomycetia bacterium]|nr:putative hydratase [Actinomycetes bacterium]